jgi:hypothetical protein
MLRPPVFPQPGLRPPVRRLEETSLGNLTSLRRIKALSTTTWSYCSEAESTSSTLALKGCSQLLNLLSLHRKKKPVKSYQCLRKAPNMKNKNKGNKWKNQLNCAYEIGKLHDISHYQDLNSR